MTLYCCFLKGKTCTRTMIVVKRIKCCDRTREKGSERGQEIKGVQKRGSRGNK